MAKQFIANSRASVSVEYYATCAEGDLEISIRDNMGEAYADAAEHRKEPGCANHVIQVVTVQHTRLLFAPDEPFD